MIELVFHNSIFCSEILVSASFHTREIVEEGVGHLRSYRRSTDRLGSWIDEVPANKIIE